MLADLTFKSFLQGPFKKKAQVFKIVLKIFCKISFIYLTTNSPKRPIIILTTKSREKLSESWLQSDLKGGENKKKAQKMRFYPKTVTALD